MANYNSDDFGFRLKQARIRAKLSLDELVKRIDGVVSKQALSKYEKGQMAPSSTILIALANALDTDINYFFRPITPDLLNLEVSFRKKSSLGAKDVKALKVEIQDDIERFLEIEEILCKEEKDINIFENVGILSSSDQIVKQAIDLRKSWGLGNMPISNIQDTLEANGIKVIFSEGPEGFDGVSGVVNQNTLIMVLNSKVDMIERQRFTAMHELAHLLLNKYIDPAIEKREREKMCDAFANEMLVPSEVLREIFEGKSRISVEELAFIQKQYGISIDAIMHKLKDLKIISEARYRNFNILKNTKPLFKNKVEESRFEEVKTSRFEAMVYGALASELITESKAASLLKLPLETVRQNIALV